MNGHPGATPQMQHASYSKNPQRAQHPQYAQHPQMPAPQAYSPRVAYADQRGAPQGYYPPAHTNGIDRADRSWNAGSQHPSSYSSRRGSVGPPGGF
ncbi:hypothetical protein GGI10_004392 [Coemansia sp. RSA 2530]|nr:hypothetical protein GGI06_001211 [Coemansia sp. S85]KAJ2411194.1 hypothetical protein GGI10_004392 [Coemansia sp. RSA 2530]